MENIFKKIVIARPRSGRGNLAPSSKERDCFVAALLAMTVFERLQKLGIVSSPHLAGGLARLVKKVNHAA